MGAKEAAEASLIARREETGRDLRPGQQGQAAGRQRDVDAVPGTGKGGLRRQAERRAGRPGCQWASPTASDSCCRVIEKLR